MYFNHLKLNPKSKELIDPNFVTKIEQIIANYNSEKNAALSEIESYKNSKYSSLTEKVNEMWISKINEYKDKLSSPEINIESLVNGKINEELSSAQKQYFAIYLKASMVYAIKSTEGFNESFESGYNNNFYEMQDISRLLLKQISLKDFSRSLRKNIELKEINSFTERLISQLALMYPEYKSLNQKEDSIDLELYQKLSDFCKKERFIESFSAEVEKCVISSSLEKKLVPSGSPMDWPIGGHIPHKEISYFVPSTILYLNHETIKKCVIPKFSIPINSGTMINFDADLSFNLVELVDNLKYIKLSKKKTFEDKSEFEQLLAKRKPMEIEFVNSRVDLPQNISYEIK
jgi:hypothetical protein